MPAVSEKVVRREELQTKWETYLYLSGPVPLLITKDLFDVLKASRWDKNWTDYQDSHYAPHQVEKIIELLTIDANDDIEAGDGDFIQWQEKLIDIQENIAQIVTKNEVSLEDAKTIIETSQALDRYFNNFTSPTEANPKYFRHIHTHVAYGHLYVSALAIKTVIDNYIEESKKVTNVRSFVDRDKEVSSFQAFVTQFESLQNKSELNDDIRLQYDTRLSWIEKYFPSIIGNVEILGSSYFSNLNNIQHTNLQNRVMTSYDDLQIKHNRLISQIE